MSQESVPADPVAKKAPDTAAFNHWFTSVLADSRRAQELKTDWRKLLLAELPVSAQQKEHLSSVPTQDAKDLQDAIATVVDHGGAIHIERDSETSPGKLIVQPKQIPGGVTAKVSFHFFHCTFDAYCQNWHCGWGPK